jgi:mannose-6-phosphate isomerase-like protein (cupin superfamily)
MSHKIIKKGEPSSQKITCGIMRELISSKDFSEMNIVRVEINDSTKRHYHKKLTEFYFVLTGSVDVDIDGEVRHLEEGDIIMISPNTEHEAWKTSEKAELLVIACPPWVEEDELQV